MAALIQFSEGIMDFVCLDSPAADPTSIWLQFPLAGTAIVPAYHISSLSTNESLILDGETLAMIFTGNISTWDDPAIQLLNPNLTLPNANITLVISPAHTLAQTDTIGRFLSLSSEEFAREYAQVVNDFTLMRPAMEGRALIASGESDRLQYVQVTLYCRPFPPILHISLF